MAPKNYLCRVYSYAFMMLITAMFLYGRSQDSLLSVPMRGVQVVLSTAGFKGGGKSCPKKRETAGRPPESLAHLAGIELKPLMH